LRKMTNSFPHKSAILSLCEKLNLQPPDEFEQDWEYVVVDPYRIDDFLGLYKNDERLRENEKVILGILIIGSLNEALEIGILSEDLWHVSWRVLRADFALHADTFDYWACWDEEDVTNCFPISQKLRAALEKMA